jgi:hypothetical protein
VHLAQITRQQYLAKRLVDPDADADASLEAMFAETRALEAEAEESLNEAHRLGAEPIPLPAQPSAAVCPPEPVPTGAPAVVATAPPDRRSAQRTLDLAARPATSRPTVAPDASGPAVPPVGQLDLFAS